MKIFITGSTGFIGLNLIRFYNTTNTIIEYKRGECISTALNNCCPDLIFHCAGEIYKDDLMISTNVLMTKDILEYVKLNPKTKLIYTGSSSEYGKVPRASAETDRIDPVDMYQATKGAATLLCQGYARHYDLDIKIARPYSVYGRFERSHRLFPTMWRSFFKDQEMTLWQGYHDFIYIDDFIRGLDIIANSEKNPGDIINLGSGIQSPNFGKNGVYDIFKELTNRKGNVNIMHTLSKNFESEVWKCDTEYAKSAYAFEAKYTLRDGIKEFLEYTN